MCSLEDGIPVEPVDIDSSDVKDVSKCFKCGADAVTTARMKDPFCQICFCAYFNQKFRTTLGKLRVTRPGDKICLAYSGGYSSTVLLKLLVNVLSDYSSRKVPTSLSVIFIDEGAVLGFTKQERCNIAADVLSIATTYKVPSSFIALEYVFGRVYRSTDCSDLLIPDSGRQVCKDKLFSVISETEDLQAQLLASFENLMSLSAKESFLRILRHRVLMEVALQHGYTKVFVGDDANNVSARLISSIAQGRGSTLPLDTGFVDNRNKNVSLIRPLREFQCREIVDFARWNDLRTVSIPTLRKQSANKCVRSIGSITETFVGDLQEKFPSTLNTIFRTGEKLSVPCTHEAGNTVCDLCQAPMTKHREDFIYTHLSQESIGPSIDTRYLCYGCCLIVKDMRIVERSFLPLI